MEVVKPARTLLPWSMGEMEAWARMVAELHQNEQVWNIFGGNEWLRKFEYKGYYKNRIHKVAEAFQGGGNLFCFKWKHQRTFPKGGDICCRP